MEQLLPDILMNDDKFQEAFSIANKIWLRIKENG
jgi:hypothetical protein